MCDLSEHLDKLRKCEVTGWCGKWIDISSNQLASQPDYNNYYQVHDVIVIQIFITRFLHLLSVLLPHIYYALEIT